MVRAALITHAALLILLPAVAALRLAPVGPCTRALHASTHVPVMVDEGSEPPPPAEPEVRNSRGSDMPTNFLGVFDVQTTTGSLGASLVVAGGFGVLIELLKFFDRAPLAV